MPEPTGEFAHLAEAEPAHDEHGAAEGHAAGGHAAEGLAAVEHGANHEALELTLMGVSSGIAFLGIGFAAFVWLRRRDLAASAARSLAPVHRTLLKKYYVDEIYDAVIVRPIHAFSRDGLWRMDAGLVDGAVNGVAAIVAHSASALRRLQTGSVRAYAGSVLVGVVLLLGYYFWR